MPIESHRASPVHSAARPGRSWAGVNGKRDALERVFQQLREAPREVLSEQARKDILMLDQKFRSSRFHLVFLGQFKRGKTSLLNSFLGMELLPTGVLPVTSIVTIVRHGPSLAVRVQFVSGENQEIAAADLPSYVTERGNPRNEKRVSEVEALVPSPALQDNLCLVDTPGIGSIFEHNTRLAYDFVPKADAAVFVFSPEPPLSQVELEFLHHLRSQVGKIFFVLNKADQLTASEREEILDFAQQAIRRHLPEGELRLFSVSARQALSAQRAVQPSDLTSSGLPGLMEAIRHFLSEHSGDVLIRSTAMGLRRLISNELLSLELEERAAALPAEELTGRMRTIERIWEGLALRHREIAPILRAEIRTLEESLAEELKTFVEGEVDALRHSMRVQLQARRRVAKKQVVTEMDEALRGKIAEIFEEWKAREEKAVGAAFETLTARLSAEATQAVQQIQDAAAEQFGFHWKAAPLPDRLEAQSTFSIEVEPLMSWGMGQFPFLLPRFGFVRYLASHLEESCLTELHRNAGRLREDLGDRMEKSVHEFLKGLNRYLEQARDSVLRALARAAAMSGAASEEKQRIEQALVTRMQFLKETDDQLANVLSS